MKRYTFTALVTISISTEVKAHSEEDAFRIAESRGMQSLCYSCASQDATEQWVTSGEFDGEAQNIQVQEVVR